MSKKERFLIWFWSKIPNSWLYWAVNQAWAKATTTEFTDRSPNEVTWDMMQRYLSGRPQRKVPRRTPSVAPVFVDESAELTPEQASMISERAKAPGIVSLAGTDPA